MRPTFSSATHGACTTTSGWALRSRTAGSQITSSDPVPSWPRSEAGDGGWPGRSVTIAKEECVRLHRAAAPLGCDFDVPAQRGHLFDLLPGATLGGSVAGDTGFFVCGSIRHRGNRAPDGRTAGILRSSRRSVLELGQSHLHRSRIRLRLRGGTVSRALSRVLLYHPPAGVARDTGPRPGHRLASGGR